MSNWTNLTDSEIHAIREQARFWRDTWRGAEFDAAAFALEIQAALHSKNRRAPAEVWLGNGDKSVADIYAEDGSYAGIGIFQPENGRTGAIGQSDGEIDGRPLDEVNAIVLIYSTRPESLQVMIDELTEAMAHLGATPTNQEQTQ